MGRAGLPSSAFSQLMTPGGKRLAGSKAMPESREPSSYSLGQRALQSAESHGPIRVEDRGFDRGWRIKRKAREAAESPGRDPFIDTQGVGMPIASSAGCWPREDNVSARRDLHFRRPCPAFVPPVPPLHLQVLALLMSGLAKRRWPSATVLEEASASRGGRAFGDHSG